MATNTQTTSGKKIRWGIQELPHALITSAETTYAREVKTYKNEIGETVSTHEYDHRIEGSFSLTMLADTDVSAIEADVKEWLTTVATGDVYALPAGGTVIVSDLKMSEQNEDAATCSITATYYPHVSAETAEMTS